MVYIELTKLYVDNYCQFRDNLDAYFDKHVRENILNEKLSRLVLKIKKNDIKWVFNGTHFPHTCIHML